MFCIQDPSYDNSMYLHETLLSECVGCTNGAGAYAFATKDGINLLLLDDNFKEFLKTGTFTLVVGTDDITNEHSIVSLIELQKKYGSHLVVKAYVHNERGSTFHPKFSWFKKNDGGTLVLGSGNLTQKGLRHNREAYNVIQYDESSIAKIIEEWNRWFTHSSPFLFDITDPVVLAKTKQNTEKIRAISTAKATVQRDHDIKPGDIKLNIIITFHQEFNGLWLRTIESNYEFDTVYAWIDHWLDVRKCACDLLAASSTCLHKLLGNRKLGDAGNLFDALHNRYNKMMVAHLSYPREHRPFEKKPEIPTLFNKAKRDYFDGIHNFANQLISFIKKEEQTKRLAIYNLKAALAALPNVQKFFDDITLDGEHQSKHVELCALEEKVIFETYMCCEYYLSHAPETNYNKYQVKAWFSSSKKTEIDEINSTMTDLSSIYDAVLPKSSYRDNTFLCYPILFKNFDPANDEMMNAFLITSISFAKSPYDYLLLLLINNAGEVIPNAIKFPKKAFKYIHNAIDLGVEEEMDPLASPYPIEVTEKMLECFDGKYILQKQEPTNIWLGHIADIGEELWMYSKNREYLVDEEDKQYLFNNLNEIKNRIDGMVKDIEPNVSVDILTAVNELCNAVYQGDLFDDKKYNELISCVQTASA